MSQQHYAAAHRASTSAVAQRRDWWRDAVIYQVYPRSFADSNGDGMGDLEGIRTRLPYLRDLGVDAVWLSPFYASPQADAGYDVADYRAIDPMFGNLPGRRRADPRRPRTGPADHRRPRPQPLLRPARMVQAGARRGPGLAAARALPLPPGKGDERRTAAQRLGVHLRRPRLDARSADGEWYLHLFAPEQPDFNWDHPAVRDEFRSILRFWLDMGVDGFRIDVAHGLVKAPGLPDLGPHDQLKLLGNEVLPFFDQDGVHEIYRSWRTVLDEYAGERIAVAEAWTPTVERTAHYVRPDELHQAFNFQYLSTGWDAAALREAIDASLDAMRPVGAPPPGCCPTTTSPARHPSPTRRPRHPDPQAGDRDWACAGPRRHPADAGAARLGLPLPGRGARPARGRRPARRGPPGPRLLPGRRPGRLPRRLPGADPVERARAVVRLRRRRQLAAPAGRAGPS